MHGPMNPSVWMTVRFPEHCHDLIILAHSFGAWGGILQKRLKFLLGEEAGLASKQVGNDVNGGLIRDTCRPAQCLWGRGLPLPLFAPTINLVRFEVMKHTSTTQPLLFPQASEECDEGIRTRSLEAMRWPRGIGASMMNIPESR